MGKKMTIILTVIILIAAAGAYYIYGPRKPNPRATLTVGSTTFTIEVASTTPSRAQGLSGRAELAENEGMFFIFPWADRYDFWMKDMKFAIDIVWIKDDRVVGFTENVAPEPGKSVFSLTKYSPPEPVNRVLELSAGSVKKFSIKVGDRVEF